MEVDEFSLHLFEHIMALWFEAGAIPDPDHFPDMTEVTEISRYLLDEEELLQGITEDNMADRVNTVLTIGLFIHGYAHRNDDR